MTDKEIIKAVERCLSGKEELCKECPLNGKCYGDVDYLLESLDIINRQQEQLEAAANGQETLQKALAEKDREVERLTAEKDQLIKTFGECQAEAAKEILKNEKEIERLNNNISAMAITMHNCAKATRAEAIRVFAERLKSLLALNKQVSNESFYYITTDIDNLVKEMVGDAE